MKRLFTIIFIVSCCFAFTISCTNSNNPSASSGADSSKTSLVILGLGYHIIDTLMGSGAKPVLNDLVITSSNSTSITLAKPTLSTAGSPAPTVKAFIGIEGDILLHMGIFIVHSSNNLRLYEGIDVSKTGCTFSDLIEGTNYKIYVVANNSAGYSVQQIVQSTGGVAPVMNNLSISASDANSITLAQPSFSTAGYPSPTVEAYIGLTGTISVSGSTVSGSTAGPDRRINGRAYIQRLGHQYDLYNNCSCDKQRRLFGAADSSEYGRYRAGIEQPVHIRY